MDQMLTELRKRFHDDDEMLTDDPEYRVNIGLTNHDEVVLVLNAYAPVFANNSTSVAQAMALWTFRMPVKNVAEIVRVLYFVTWRLSQIQPWIWQLPTPSSMLVHPPL